LINLTSRIYDSEEFDLAVEALEDSLDNAPDGELAQACRKLVMLTKILYTGTEMEDAIADVLKARNAETAKREKKIKPHNKKAIIGKNEEGWWTVNPEPAINQQDIEKLEQMVHGIESKEKLIDFLMGLGYQRQNIVEGILG
jgi:hypothetical protein